MEENHPYYLYSKEELEPWARKVNDIAKKAKRLRIYLNNHYAGAAIINAFMFEKMLRNELSQEQEQMLEHAEQFYLQHGLSKNQRV